MPVPLSLTLYDYRLADPLAVPAPLEEAAVQEVFHLLDSEPLFQWQRNHNFCEARAEAASLLLEAAGLPHAKCWVFGAAFLYKGYVGGLLNHWNYHVAVAMPVQQNGRLQWLVLDPSTARGPLSAEAWASAVTAYPHSYHLLKQADYYIFPAPGSKKPNWYRRHHRNFRLAMQGLAGINSLRPTGKAQLVFDKQNIARTTHQFRQLLHRMQGWQGVE
ncbi:MAG TPA: protein-glutamine glutaminase family protein [Phnomibacter sp.]|nr:protein-glutamine glutaminase family protein [Phnomibacter sp.]